MPRHIRKEALILPRTVYSFNHESDHAVPGYLIHPPCGKRQGDEPACQVDQSPEIDRHYVGQIVQHHVGAPGVGYREYEITKVDTEGLWGVLVRSTVRILTAAEVR